MVPPLAETEYKKGFKTAKENCVRILSRLASIAHEYEMKLCFELVGLKRSSVRTIRQAREIVEAVSRPDVGYVFDTFNIYSYDCSNDFSGIKEVSKETIFAVHVNNADECDPNEMTQEKRRFCDRGAIRLDRFFKSLKKTGYDGMVSIETFRPEYWRLPPTQVIQEAFRTTRDVLERNNAFDCMPVLTENLK